MTRERFKYLLSIAFDHGFATKHEQFLLASQVVEAISINALMPCYEVEWLLDGTNSAARAMKNAIGDAYVAGRWGEYEQVN